MRTIRRLVAAAVTVALAIGFVWANPASVAIQRRTYHALLDGFSVVPVIGSSNGSGSASPIVVTRGDGSPGRVCYALFVSNIGTATSAHIHKAPAGSNGPIVATLSPPNPRSHGCVSVSGLVALDLLASPSGYYVDVHTAQYPGGAIRGQLQS